MHPPRLLHLNPGPSVPGPWRGSWGWEPTQGEPEGALKSRSGPESPNLSPQNTTKVRRLGGWPGRICWGGFLPTAAPCVPLLVTRRGWAASPPCPGPCRGNCRPPRRKVPDPQPVGRRSPGQRLRQGCPFALPKETSCSRRVQRLTRMANMARPRAQACSWITERQSSDRHSRRQARGCREGGGRRPSPFHWHVHPI